MSNKSILFYFLNLLFLSVLVTNSLSAQYDDLKNNTDIPWIAEFSMDHDFSFQTENDDQNIIKLIKLYSDPTNMEGANSDRWIIDWIYYNAINGHYQCFKDPGLTQQISNKELSDLNATIDTIITFYPEKFEEVIQIVRNELNPSSIKSLRTNQLVYHNQKSKNFETKLISVAPLVESETTKGLTPLFWIKLDANVPQKFDIHHPNITWGALIDTKGSPLFSNFIQIVKNEKNFDFRKQLHQQAFKLEKPIESAEGYGCDIFLNKLEIESMYNSIDTIITFDPQTFQETVEIRKNDIDPNEITHYRLVQEWYYDVETKLLMNRLKAICPLAVIQDNSGKIKYAPNGARRYAKPFYYIKYD